MTALRYIVAFVLGVSLASAYTADRIADLRVKVECAYHEGSDDGYATGWADARRQDYTPSERQATHQSRD